MNTPAANPPPARNAYCAPLVSRETKEFPDSPESLRRLRLVIDRGGRRRPHIVPIVVWASSDRAAMKSATRAGRRFYGKRLSAVVHVAKIRLEVVR